jgi:hypothetical protein
VKSAAALLVALCAALAGVLWATRNGAPAPLRWQPVPRPLSPPAAPPAGQPQLTVSARGILLSWIERDGERAVLRFAERAGSGWSAPRTVAAGDDWFVNWADVPSVLRLDDRTLAAHWLQKRGAAPYAYDVRLAYSTDDGRSWSPSFTPHHDGLEREHGFASLYRLADGGLGLVWLDGREMAAADGHEAGGAEGGAMTVRSATFDGGWTQTSEAAVDLRVCECCPTAAATTSEGPIVAYRDRDADETRDIYVSRVEHGRWTPSRAVHADGWRIAACPVNGPALSARGRDVALAWFTGVGDVGHAYVAFSRDAGRTFGPPIRLDDQASLGRVGVAWLPDGSAAASWIETGGPGTSLAVRKVSPSGATSPALTVAPIPAARASGYPRLASDRGELVIAWVDLAGTPSLKAVVLAEP